jgi:phosphoribosylaminoimidazole-succinocarboxamide synthase
MTQILREEFMEYPVIINTNFKELTLLGRGKVRDIYEVDGYLLLVASDRLSAFDVVLPDPIPYKGVVLTQMSVWWFHTMSSIIDHHLVSDKVDEYPASCRPYREELQGRSMLVKKVSPLPVECVVRGYLAGSGWVDYKKTGSVCGIKLPEGLLEASELSEPVFTPSTKAERGLHDENISQEKAAEILGSELAAEIMEKSKALYSRGRDIAREKGIIIADTKFEFGRDGDQTILIDEILTPDSSRFWPLSDYRSGQSPLSFDKQYVRDYLLTLDWDKKPPAPKLPQEVIENTTAKYMEAYRRLTGKNLL